MRAFVRMCTRRPRLLAGLCMLAIALPITAARQKRMR